MSKHEHKGTILNISGIIKTKTKYFKKEVTIQPETGKAYVVQFDVYKWHLLEGLEVGDSITILATYIPAGKTGTTNIKALKILDRELSG